MIDVILEICMTIADCLVDLWINKITGKGIRKKKKGEDSNQSD